MADLPLAFSKSLLTFQRPVGRDILKRTGELEEWLNQRRLEHVWPYTAALHQRPAPQTVVSVENETQREGINFASQDYLSLTRHPSVIAAAKEALDFFGPHSAGSGILQGNTTLSKQLETKLAEALATEHVVLYPTGWGAGYGVVTGLVRPGDVVIMDQLAHACLQAGVAAATPNILRHKHLQVNEVPALLKEVRGKGHEAGIMVITEGLFSMDSDIPRLGELQDACKEYEAVLVVDVAHDFGSLGPNGTGALGLQGLIGKVDLVMGSFSKTFSSNGGFVATHSAAVRDFLRIFSSPHTFSNALSPIQSAIILECLRIVRSEEGEQRRQKMLSISRLLRDELAKEGITCIGEPSPIVPAIIGKEPLARLAARRLRSHSIFANLVEFPAVGVNKARFRLQVMADHDPHQAVAAAKAVSASISEATRDFEELMAASAIQGE